MVERRVWMNRLEQCAKNENAHYGGSHGTFVDVQVPDLEAIIEENTCLRMAGWLLLNALSGSGYPVSEAMWENERTGKITMSLEAKLLHIATANFRAALSEIPTEKGERE